MKWLLPDTLVGALAGFGLGVMLSFNLGFLGVDGSSWPSLGLGLVGAILGCMVGACLRSPDARARTIARWCATMSVALGVVAFLIGFVGPIILSPDSPQGPLLGIFVTGPLGALAGAILGAIFGMLAPSRSVRL